MALKVDILKDDEIEQLDFDGKVMYRQRRWITTPSAPMPLPFWVYSEQKNSFLSAGTYAIKLSATVIKDKLRFIPEYLAQ